MTSLLVLYLKTENKPFKLRSAQATVKVLHTSTPVELKPMSGNCELDGGLTFPGTGFLSGKSRKSKTTECSFISTLLPQKEYYLQI